MCRFLVFDRKLEFQVKSQILGKNGSFWGGQNLAKTCTQKFENGHMVIADTLLLDLIGSCRG